MSFESEQVCLADVCSDVSYGYTEGATAQPIGPKFLRITDIQGGSFDWSTVPFCPATEDNVRKYQLQVGDIVVARTGNSTGENAQVVQEPPAAVFASYLIRFRPNSGRVNPFFVGYQLRSERFKQHVLAVRGGSAQPGANAKQLGAFTFHLIPRNLQDEAVESLRTLDDRIALLRETNATLEAIAQALFKSWFVDFDPVHAKARGEQPEALPEPLAALFPDSFEESPLGLVPRGWRVGVFADICARIESGGTPKRTVPEYWNGNVSWLTSGEVRNPIVFETRETISDLGMKESSAKLWPQGTTVVAMYAATAGEVCLVAKPMTANQACCGLIPNPHTRAFMYVCARRERESLASKSSGSAQQNLNKGLVESHPTVLPPDDLLRAYEDIAGVMLDGWIANAQQAHTLSTLRDTLLPRLISGQLRLPEAEAEALAA